MKNSLVIFLTIGILLAAVLKPVAQTSGDLNRVRRQIASTESELKKIASDRSATVRAIDLLQQKSAAERQVITLLTKEINSNTAGVKRLQAEEVALSAQREQYSEKARTGTAFLVENSGMVTAKAVFSGIPGADTARLVEIVNKLNSGLSEEIEAYVETVNEMEVLRQQITVKNERLIADKKESEITYAGYESSRRELNRRLTAVRQDESAQKGYLAMLEAEQMSINKAIEANRRLQNESPFARLKGSYPYPMKGAVTERYGMRIHLESGVRIMHNGIRIQPSGGGDVSAIADGTVVYTDFINGMQNVLIIQHDKNYYTVYANIDEYYVNPTQTVAKGGVIGRVNTELPPGSAYLYFEVRNHEQALDPLVWLK